MRVALAQTWPLPMQPGDDRDHGEVPGPDDDGDDAHEDEQARSVAHEASGGTSS